MPTIYFLGQLEKAEDLQLSEWGENQNWAGRAQQDKVRASAKLHSIKEQQLEKRSEIFGMDLFEKWENSCRNGTWQRCLDNTV